jgi:hypothetical protein
MFMFCIIGASAEKPCDCPSTDNGESLLGRIEECARMRPYEEPPIGVGEAVAILCHGAMGWGRPVRAESRAWRPSVEVARRYGCRIIQRLLAVVLVVAHT